MKSARFFHVVLLDKVFPYTGQWLLLNFRCRDFFRKFDSLVVN